MRRKLYILAGIPGTGKSTWAHNFFDASLIVSSDAIRAELYGDDEYDSERNEEVFDQFHKRIEWRLGAAQGYQRRAYQYAVADSTALSPEARLALRMIAAFHAADVHLVMFTATAQGFENNPKRASRWVVPPDAMDVMLEKYKLAIEDVKSEGYTSITYINGVQ